jgi:hypothetical protein
LLASVDPGVRPGLEWHPNGIPVAVAVQESPELGGPPGAPSEAALRRDSITRELMAVRRDQLRGERLARVLEERGAEFRQHEAEVIEQLQAAGYLRDKPGTER